MATDKRESVFLKPKSSTIILEGRILLSLASSSIQTNTTAVDVAMTYLETGQSTADGALFIGRNIELTPFAEQRKYIAVLASLDVEKGAEFIVIERQW